MKKILLLLIIIICSMSAMNAQVRVGLGLGYAVPSGDIADFADGGITGYLEAGYGVTDHLDISLMYQGDFLVSKELDGVEVGAITLSNVLVNGRFYLIEKVFKPYVGLGLGLTNVKQGSVSITDGEDIAASSESNFAFRPSLGFKMGVLNVNAAYLSAGKIEEASVADLTFNIGLLFSFGI